MNTRGHISLRRLLSAVTSFDLGSHHYLSDVTVQLLRGQVDWDADDVMLPEAAGFTSKRCSYDQC